MFRALCSCLLKEDNVCSQGDVGRRSACAKGAIVGGRWRMKAETPPIFAIGGVVCYSPQGAIDSIILVATLTPSTAAETMPPA